MPSINEVIERAYKVRPDAYDDETKAGWLMELEGKLLREVVARHALNEGEEMPTAPAQYPEDGDKPLLVGPPHDRLYELYLLAQVDFYNREMDHYNNSVTAYNAAVDEWRQSYHRSHAPVSAGGVTNLF